MASNTDKGIETTNAGVKETIVNTVDYRSPAGEDEPTKKENVQIVHETKPGDETSGVLAAAAAAVTNTVNSAKDAIKK
ncbi:hypothetical protein FRX31_032182 [Thalictrum thalictroides]|uniref:Uncharacterized protein n=1 Tax=Thalictrum thalictroides TaxID=46969 RepID=A0A7J6V0G4_THATH|nr:hypothetical protein FRX31_032182 [Thalictrum thalictroides]